MAILFPEPVSAAVEFTSGSPRANGLSNGYSSAVILSDESCACPVEKRRQASDEDFSAVLALMVGGISALIPPVVVGSKTETAATTSIEQINVGEVKVSPRSEQSASQHGLVVSTVPPAVNSSSPPVVSQFVRGTSEIGEDDVPVRLGDPGPLPTARDSAGDSAAPSNGSESLLQGESSNSVRTPVRSQSMPEKLNPEFVSVAEFQSMQLPVNGSLADDVQEMSALLPAGRQVPARYESESLVLSESLPHDVIDALERVGRVTGSTASDVSGFELPEIFPTASASPAFDPTTLMMRDPRLPAKPTAAMLEISGQETGSSLSVPILSVRFESVVHKKTENVVPSVFASNSELPVAPIVSAKTLASNAIENETLFAGVLSAPEQSRELHSAVTTFNVPSVSRNIELAIKPVRVRNQSTSVSTDAATEGLLPIRERHALVSTSSEIVRSEVVQLNTANSFSEIAASVSGHAPQPLSSQVSDAIIEHIERGGVRPNDAITVRLDPPELGEMKIELSNTLDGLAVRVTAREAVTMDMLFARGQEIESQLRGQQMNLKSLEFLRADTSGNTFSQGQPQNSESSSSEGFMNQFRRGSRSSNPAIANIGRITTSESAYGFSFRA